MSDTPPKLGITVSSQASLAELMDLLKRSLCTTADETGLRIDTLNVNINPGTVVICGQQVGDIKTRNGEEIMNEKTDIHAVNSVVNYKSTLQNVQTMLSAPNQAQDSKEVTAVQQDLARLAQMLQAADAKHAEEVEAVARRLEELSKEITKPSAQRKRGLIALSAKGLKEAAEAVGDIVPGLLATATSIAAAIANLMP